MYVLSTVTVPRPFAHHWDLAPVATGCAQLCVSCWFCSLNPNSTFDSNGTTLHISSQGPFWLTPFRSCVLQGRNLEGNNCRTTCVAHGSSFQLQGRSSSRTDSKRLCLASISSCSTSRDANCLWIRVCLFAIHLGLLCWCPLWPEKL